ncbi:uncharacterized protein LOC132842949 [Tachysurus vachellii]|uniref:uncharacterized protein LOC132842949 n=1 Tax=Tachysurus vachellii TaxID=175792 RepID=UPI00296B52DD|nr:uncharacterized protein LOC132842949 [Tachysurus vachellii]
MASLTQRGTSPVSLRHGVRCMPANGVSVEEVLLAMGKEVGNENIFAASRMNKAVVVFPREENQARHLTNTGIVAQSMESAEKSLKSVFKVVKKYKDDFNLNNVMEGDVFIVKDERKVQKAGLYTDGQIIQLQVLTGIFYNSTEINKVNVEAFTRGKSFAVYRKEKGIPQSFKNNVDEAMSKCPETNFHGYNCMEFVMELLEVYLPPIKSDCSKIAFGTKPKGFKVVKNFADDYNSNAMLGDLFLVQGGPFGYLQAGVCCSEKGPKIIQLTGKSLISKSLNL